MASPKGGTPVESGIIQRIGTGLRFALSGKSAADFFGPGEAMPPAAQEETHGRRFDYETNFNIQTRPRANEPIDFATLRSLADTYDLVRLAIETRKDQMGKLKWTIARKDGKDQDTTAKAIEAFFQEPDGEHDFLDWSRMLLEDLLVIDAPAVYIHPTLGGDPVAFEQIDGATITRKLDGRGRTPAPPQPGEAFDPKRHTAYQQIIKGLPATDYHRDELIYRPRNPRIHKVYGFSPVEQIIVIVNLGLRREAHQLAFYTSGNIPEMIMSTPKEWTPDMIAQFQKLWDQITAGDVEARRRLRFVPNDVKPLMLRPETSLFDAFDEWLARVVCFCFSLPPNAFVKQQNRATAESAQDVALEEGLAPLMEWKKRLMDQLIRKGFKTDDYEFRWVDDEAMDPKIQADIDNIYVTSGIRLPSEVREDHNWPANPELDARKLAPPTPPGGGSGGTGEPAAGDKKDPSKTPTTPVDDTASKLLTAVLAKMHAADSATEDAATGRLVASVLELRTMIEKMQAVAPAEAIPTATQMADALDKMVTTGVPLNQALKAVGYDFTVPGGDVAMVSAARIPLSIAADPAGFESPPARVEKRADPAPAPIVVTPTVLPAPTMEFKPTFNISLPESKGGRVVTMTRPDGSEVSATITAALPTPE